MRKKGTECERVKKEVYGQIKQTWSRDQKDVWIRWESLRWDIYSTSTNLQNNKILNYESEVMLKSNLDWK